MRSRRGVMNLIEAIVSILIMTTILAFVVRSNQALETERMYNMEMGKLIDYISANKELWEYALNGECWRIDEEISREGVLPEGKTVRTKVYLWENGNLVLHNCTPFEVGGGRVEVVSFLLAGSGKNFRPMEVRFYVQ